MNKEFQEECKQLVRKYQNYKSDKYKVECRNKLYLKMKPWMEKYVKAKLGNWHKWDETTDLLGLSWDSFCLALKNYNNINIPLPSHFHRWVRYFLLMYYAQKEGGIKIEENEFIETLNLVRNPLNVSFLKLLDLKRFREMLPEWSHIIFDDALQSVGLKSTDRNKKKSKHGMDTSCYYKIKIIYIEQIKWLMGVK